MAKELCEDCGKVFEAGPRAFLCERCRRKRLSESAKKRSLNKLGTVARTGRSKPCAARINPCTCGGSAEFIKLFESKRYDGFVRCTKCGKESRTYTSKQNAIKSWNKKNLV